MTLYRKLAALANPSAGFIQKIRLLEDAIPGLSFANGWVSCPPAAPQSQLGELPPIPVSGHGNSRDLALGRLMMEAVERNSSVYIGSEKLITANLQDLHSISVHSLLPYSNKQYASRQTHLPSSHPSWIPKRLTDNAVIGCVQAETILENKSRLIPAAFVYLGYAAPGEPIYAVADSNGCAAGETREEAIYRGLLEIIERDALAIWWFNRVRRPALTFPDDELLCAVELGLHRERRSLILLDLTHDLDVPVVVSLTADQQGGRIYIGAAADVTLRSAARRAVCEMLQFWLWGRVSVDPPGRIEWLRNETLTSQPWLNPASSQALHESEMRSKLALPDLARKVANSGCEPLFVDLTRPWFQIPVVKVVAPGLRSLAPSFAPGRLYDVPVKLGWLNEPTTEAHLMKYTCPI